MKQDAKILELVRSGQFTRFETPMQNAYGPVRPRIHFDVGNGIQLVTYNNDSFLLYIDGKVDRAFSTQENGMIVAAFAEMRQNKASQYL